jgi:formate-dependent nitrite reductase cytochrome c552 subunit
VFTASENTANCISCHTFGGPVRTAHNAVVTEGSNLGDVSCEMCHTEHKGAPADIVEINNVQCASCHKDKFTSFSRGYPAFSDRFPYFRRTAIRFDHASHFAKHFADQRFTDRAPPTCAACHGASTDKRSLVRAGFEKTCAACHGNQMAQRELVLLRLPEFPEPGIDRESVLDACGPTPDEIEKLIERNEERLAAEEAEREEEEEEEEEEEYESVSDEEKSIVGAYLFDVTADDPDEYGANARAYPRHGRRRRGPVGRIGGRAGGRGRLRRAARRSQSRSGEARRLRLGGEP